jgi:hypothetical protein
MATSLRLCRPSSDQNIYKKLNARYAIYAMYEMYALYAIYTPAFEFL